ncbi:hypothetical protein POM88_009825 [Heracleum sosnowskyi]|uniref:SWIM-type domain-containing protein n=1 Tax=Heracleum sosnowskyi TaxID=360622 RepID=A0AAD8N8J1_9APIA|nr:hypothetical protein POM88_009825 [Heracleum sosnowskyi]
MQSFMENEEVLYNSAETSPNPTPNSDNLTHDLGDDWIPECDIEKKPIVGQLFPDIDTTFNFYYHYGSTCGFVSRRSTERKNKQNKITRKYFVCSRAGLPEDDKSEDQSIKKRKTTSAKCDCPAKLILASNGNGGFYVKEFTEYHNHSFAGKGTMQFLRCSRSLTEFHKRFIIDAAKLNIGATRAHAIFKSMIGSYENVGATVVDFKKFSRDIKEYIGKHDADILIQKFKDIQASSDNNFRFEYKTDENNHLTQLFWADGVGRRNFEVFGDVISFDATYRTNKYGMVFIPFIGIDNHWKSVTFAAVLLEKEDADNYKWACESFKKFFGSSVKCIVTDQDPAMKIAIEECFPGVKHRLCMWHIMKKFPSKLGTLFCAESPFMDKLNNFVWSDHSSTNEFEAGWNDVVSEFGLSDNTWLKEMYSLRSYWVPAFFNDEPMVGLIRTTSRSESSNFYFNHFVQKGDTLSEFYLCFHSAIEKQRNNKGLLNHKDDLMPIPKNKKKIEKDAAEIYTKTMFYKIQEQITASCGDIVMEDMSVVDGVKSLKLKDPFLKNKIFEVNFNLSTHDIDCSCNLYTRVGYLCSHSFLCLSLSGISFIPRQYVNNRWLKRAEERFSTLVLSDVAELNPEEDAKRKKTRDCWFEFQGCISDASGDIEHIDFIHKSLNVVRKHIKNSSNLGDSAPKHNSIGDFIGLQVVDEVTILPPNRSNNKGCRKRIIGAAEKSLGGKKRHKRKCRKCNEFAFHDSRNCTGDS